MEFLIRTGQSRCAQRAHGDTTLRSCVSQSEIILPGIIMLKLSQARAMQRRLRFLNNSNHLEKWSFPARDALPGRWQFPQLFLITPGSYRANKISRSPGSTLSARIEPTLRPCGTILGKTSSIIDILLNHHQKPSFSCENFLPKI